MNKPFQLSSHLADSPSVSAHALSEGLVARTRMSRAVGLLFALFLALALTAVSTAPRLAFAAEPQVAAAQVSVVNINTADAATLAKHLRGVGESRAREIIRHREAFGPFASADELLEVKGIGESTLAQNRARITLE